MKNLENFNKSAFAYDNPPNTDQKRQQMLDNIRNILAIDDTTNDNKTKDTDELSTSSSMTNTNFTGNINLTYSTITISL